MATSEVSAAVPQLTDDQTAFSQSLKISPEQLKTVQSINPTTDVSPIGVMYSYKDNPGAIMFKYSNAAKDIFNSTENKWDSYSLGESDKREDTKIEQSWAYAYKTLSQDQRQFAQQLRTAYGYDIEYDNDLRQIVLKYGPNADNKTERIDSFDGNKWTSNPNSPIQFKMADRVKLAAISTNKLVRNATVDFVNHGRNLFWRTRGGKRKSKKRKTRRPIKRAKKSRKNR